MTSRITDHVYFRCFEIDRLYNFNLLEFYLLVIKKLTFSVSSDDLF